MSGITHDVKRATQRVVNMPRQVRFAAVGAINDVLFAARAAIQQSMDRNFDRVTPFIRRSVVVVRADRASLAGEVRIDPMGGGGKSVLPEKVLAAEVFSGRRRAKRSEIAFQRAGLLPQGFGMVPAKGVPLDAYGNVRGAFLVQLISYFNAFGEQGYRANMSDKRRRQLARFGKSEGGFKKVRGVQYFISRGKGEFTGRGSWARGQSQHLPAGIWSRSGTHGSDVKPVFLFVPMPAYRQRLPFHERAREAVLQGFDAAFSRRFALALTN